MVMFGHRKKKNWFRPGMMMAKIVRREWWGENETMRLC
jgi:hypothetical protein